MLWVVCASAQDKAKPIIRDTINLRGYIYYNDGTPAKYHVINSAYDQADYSNYHYKIGAQTDSNGYFVIHGAKPYDTLTIAAAMLYDAPQYYNKGSRFITIYLPPLKVIDINSQLPVKVVQKRQHPGAPAVYHPVDLNGCILFTSVYTFPVFGRGRKSYTLRTHDQSIAAFTDSVKKLISYPQSAVANNVEGTVQIGFTIDKDGRPVNFMVLKGIGYGCDQEVINAIKRCGKWTIAINNGRAVVMKQTLSVEFKLTQ